MTTWPEVWDDAVKIGLGAAIALVGVLLANRHEDKSFFRNRRADVIQRSAEQFQTSASVLVRLLAEYASYRAFPNVGRAVKLKQDAWDKVDAIISTEVGPAFLAIQALEGALIVVGAKDSAKKMEDFRVKASGFQMQALPDHVELPGLKVPTVVEVQENFVPVNAARGAALEALRADYKRS